MLRFWLIAFAALVAVQSGTSAQTLIDRGSYLVNSLMACSNCHTPRVPGQGATPDLSKLLSGGTQTFNEPFFSVKGANITPDRDTGIGAWSDVELRLALTDGVRPNGPALAMVMPSSLYKILTLRDLYAIVAYLRSVPAIRNEVQAPLYKKAVAVPDYPGAEKPMAEEALKDPVKLGFYNSALAHCMACHARTSEEVAADFKNAFGKGGRMFKGPFGESVAANITSSQKSGLGGWTDEEIRRALVEGVAKDGRKLKPPMIDYVAYYKTWKDADINAVIAWLRTLPAID